MTCYIVYVYKNIPRCGLTLGGVDVEQSFFIDWVVFHLGLFLYRVNPFLVL